MQAPHRLLIELARVFRRNDDLTLGMHRGPPKREAGDDAIIFPAAVRSDDASLLCAGEDRETMQGSRLAMGKASARAPLVPNAHGSSMVIAFPLDLS